MKKKIIIIFSIILIIGIVIALFLTLNSSSKTKETNEEINNNITVENQKIEIINDEVFIEMTLKNDNKKEIKLNTVDIIVLDLKGKEVLRIKNEVNKTLKQNESVLVSSQTKANLDSTQTYNLKIEYWL